MFAHLLADHALHHPPHLRVAQPRLRLALELRLRDPHREHRAEALADVVAAEVGVRVLQKLRLARLRVHRARQRNLESVQVRPAVGGFDRVGVPEERVRVRLLGPLQRALHLHAVHLRAERDRVVKHLGSGVQVSHVVLQAPGVTQSLLEILDAVARRRRALLRRRVFFVVALLFLRPARLELLRGLRAVPELERGGAVQERQLLHAVQDDVRVELALLLEDERVGLKAHARPFFARVRF